MADNEMTELIEGGKFTPKIANNRNIVEQNVDK